MTSIVRSSRLDVFLNAFELPPANGKIKSWVLGLIVKGKFAIKGFSRFVFRYLVEDDRGECFLV